MKKSLLIILLLTIRASQENENRRFDFTIPSTSKIYLSPEKPSLPGLPEVIDARTRTPAILTQPPIGLKAPPTNSDSYAIYNFAKAVDGQRNPVPADNSIGNDFSGQFTISDISCQNNGEELYFRASLSALRNVDQPIIERSSGSSSGSGNCKILKIGMNEYRVELIKEQFWNCGVIDCSTAESGKFFCLSLRFPTISGLRLKDDFSLTLQCRPQEKIASHTRRMSLRTIDTAARMAPRIAAGGRGSTFETDVGIYRRSLGSEQAFDARIEPGGTLVLGEDVLLRASVREGDGWRYSKMSEVTVHYTEKRQRNSKKTTVSSLWILDSEGCPNPQLRDICPGQQYKATPLETYLPLKAFMFDNMRESDEMVLSVKVTGCLNGPDCVLNCQNGHARRAKRDLRLRERNGTFDWQNDITFRVVASKAEVERFSQVKVVLLPFLMILLFLLTLLATALLFFVVKLIFKQRRLL